MVANAPDFAGLMDFIEVKAGGGVLITITSHRSARQRRSRGADPLWAKPRRARSAAGGDPAAVLADRRTTEPGLMSVDVCPLKCPS